MSAAEILGTTLVGGESITITTETGFALVYGIATDNVSLDLDLQRAARLDDPPSPPSKVILPLAASSHGPDGYFRTSAQLYNPTTSQMELRFAFLPDGSRNPLSAPSVLLAPGETRFIPDLVQFQNWAGVGSMDIETTGSGMPVMSFRAYRDSGASGNGGSAGALIGAVTETAALAAGDVGALIAPLTPEGTPMDVGVRAFDDGASIEFTLRDSAGNFKERVIRVYAPGSFRQLSTSELLSVPLGESDSITIAVFSGSALVYGAAVDSGSGDTSYQLAQVADSISPLVITTASPLPPVALGAVYSQTLTANGGIPPYSNWTITSGTFPGGLSLNSATGTISGAWTGTGGGPFNIPFNFTVKVTDSAGTTASATFHIPVISPLTITVPSQALIGTVGVAFAQTFSVTGGVPPYSSWAVTAGSLPPGLTLNSATGVVSGSPVGISGTFNFTIAVHDSSGATGSRSFVFTIQPPSISTTLGRIGSFAQVASGGGWKTQVTLINLSAVTVNAQINLYADNGSPMTLPLTFPQFGSSTSASSVNLTLSPSESLVVESEAPTSSIGVGWADVQATGALSGYSIFRLSSPGVPDSEGSVPLDSRLSPFLILPYDNTNSYQTGLALANQASAAASVTAILLDQNGVQLASSQITLPALGHASFFLNQQFSQSANQLGII